MPEESFLGGIEMGHRVSVRGQRVRYCLGVLTFGSGWGVASFGAPSGTMLFRSSTLLGCCSMEPLLMLLGKGSAPF